MHVRQIFKTEKLFRLWKKYTACKTRSKKQRIKRETTAPKWFKELDCIAKLFIT